MTKEQVKAEVLAKISGQGNQVDSGGALATILDAIVDLIPEGGGNEPLVIEIGTVEANALNTISVSAETFAEMKASFGNRPIIIKAEFMGEFELLVSGYSAGSEADAVPEGFCASGFIGDISDPGMSSLANILIVES